MLKSKLALNEVELAVFLGCTQGERGKAQNILLDIVFAFLEVPKVCQSDQLEETPCYAEVITKLRDFCAQREFATIEYLGAEIYKVLQTLVPSKIEIFVRVKKPQPVLGLKQSIFTIGDFAECTI